MGSCQFWFFASPLQLYLVGCGGGGGGRGSGGKHVLKSSTVNFHDIIIILMVIGSAKLETSCQGEEEGLTMIQKLLA